MKRLALAVLAVLPVVAAVFLATPASAAAAAKCVPVPDLEGRVWELCLR